MTIHRLLPGDEACALATARFVRDSTWTEADARSFLANRRNFLMVALEADEVVGHAVGYEMDRLDGARPMMCLYEIQVIEAYRCRGVGRRLVEALLDVCRADGYLKMWVLTDEDNVPARALYAGCGGEIQADAPVLYWWPMDR